MTTNLSADIVIIGGGIAGLWTLARLRQDGYQAILLEADQLACIQSGASQGIIHGGTKYALTGKLTHSAESIQEMPKRWKDCLNGEGEVDLRQAEKLSNHQYLWSNKSLASKITGFFASKVMTSRMQHLKKKDYVSPFDQSDFNGELYQLDEPVLDIKSVIDSLKNQFSEFIFQFNVKEIKELKNTDGSQVYNISLKEKVLHSKALILTAGSGNEALLKSL
ncbi:MAG: FAD-dependent oxidoreductase, partial [Gammaproteobacteria bacterium]|nr:FAD-dependent oxidoreductase [Gammaproteobacteria bacterium]